MKTTLLLSAALLSIAGRAQDRTAEETFKKIEDALANAKTFSLKFAVDGQKGGQKEEVKGTIQSRDDNRMRIDLKRLSQGREQESSIVSDGKRVRTLGADSTAELETPKDLHRRLAIAFARGGSSMAVGSVRQDSTKLLKLGDFKEAGPDGDRKSLTYTMSSTEDDPPKSIQVRLWYAPATFMIVRRTLTHAGPEPFTINEAYDEVALNGNLPDERFKLPPLKGSLPEVGGYPAAPAGWKKLRAAVLEFKDATGSRLATAGAEQLEPLALSSKRFDLIDRKKFAELLKEQGLDPATDPLELAKPGKVRGVDLLFVGEVTRFQLRADKRPGPGGILERTTGASPLKVDTSKMQFTSDIEVVLRLVHATNGETLGKQTGELKRELDGAACGLRVVGIGGDAKNSLQVDADSKARLLRSAVDDALRKMLAEMDGKAGR